MQKTATEIIEELKKRIAYTNPQIDLSSTGNVVVDLGVEAFANELSSLYSEEDRVRLLYLFDNDSFTDEEADILAASFGIYRHEATQAFGTATFCASTLPASGAVYTIPVGLTVSSGTSSSQSYTTTTSGVITESTPLNRTTGYYEVTVSIQATTPGAAGNAPSGSINVISGAPSGISEVYNANAIVNGTDVESTADLIARVKLTLQGRVYGTKAAYLQQALSDPAITDAVVVDPNSEFSVRGPGTVDIYVLGEEHSTATQEVSTERAEQSVLLQNQPVVKGTVSVVLDGVTYTENHGFIIAKDTTSVYAGSARGKDKLVWNTDTYNNVILTTEAPSYTITYTYNSLIGRTQAAFDDDDVRILTSDVAIRETTRLNVGMDFDIVTMPGYNKDAVISACKDGIETFINNFKLQEALRQSDIINIVENTAGVDYVKLPMRKFSLVDRDGVADIEVAPLEYLRIDSNDILIG